MRTRTVLSRLAALIVLSLTAAALTPAIISPAIAAPVATGPNLVTNPSLEAGAAWPDCFSASGWGSEAEWSLTAGHTGARAVTVALAEHVQGDRKLLQTESAACAPAVTVGESYETSIWYQSTAPVAMTLFRHTAAGWSYWGELEALPASAGWSQATAATPVIPAGTDRISFGISLGQVGTLTVDDFSLRVLAETVLATELIANGDLVAGAAAPQCFMTAGWGDGTVTGALSADVPAGSPAGARSYALTLANRTMGDTKLLQSEAAGCAPAVVEATEYDIAIDYKSTTGSIGITAFQHTVAGWSYWTEVKALPASAAWTTGTATLPPIPAGVDRVSFGISLSGDGALSTTGYSMVVSDGEPEEPVDPEEPGDPVDGEPAEIGSWEIIDTELPIRALHTTLLHDGRLLLIAGSGNSGDEFAAGTFTAVVWDPVTDVMKDIPVPYDMFCAGHVTLPDGKVLLAGGTMSYPEAGVGPTTFKGSDRSYYFDPDDDQFHPLTDMAGAHWYPSLTKLGNGDVWSAGGLDEKAEGTVLTEIFDVSAMSWLPQNQVPQTWSYWGTYPHMYLLDDGTMFYSGGHTFGNGLPGTGASLYDWETAQIWDVPGLRSKDLRDQAGSVLLPPAQDQKVMIVGGGNTETNNPAISTVDIVDLSVAAPTYVAAPDLPGPGKMYVNLLTLPDRTVLAANGAVYNRADDIETAAIFDPETETWLPIESDPIGRNYHSTAVVLPDGRALIMGSNPGDNSFEMRISMYTPPYLHRGDRPTIANVPDAANYGDTFGIQVTGDVTSASLMAPMSATHQTDTNARLVDVPLAGTGGQRTAQIPDNPNLLPPGPYMLTVLDADGVPSVAEWVWIS